MDGKYGYAKTSEVDFSRGKLAIKSYFRVGGGGGGGGGGGRILLYRQFSDGKVYYGNIIVISQGKQLFPDSNTHLSCINSAEPDQTPHNAASDQGLHCLQMSLL